MVSLLNIETLHIINCELPKCKKNIYLFLKYYFMSVDWLTIKQKEQTCNKTTVQRLEVAC